MPGGKFAQIPEWVLDADISDGAVRLYAVLARYADRKTGKAFPSRSTLAERIKKQHKSVDRHLKELVAIRALTVSARYEEGTSERRSNIYTLHNSPPPEVASQMTPPSPTDDPGVASQMTRGVASQMTHITRTTMNETHMNESAPEPTAQTLISEWIDNCASRPPGQVIGILSKQIKSLLDEGQPYAEVRAAVQAWNTKGLHPTTLPSVLHEIRNKRPGGKTTPTERIQSTAEIGRRLQQQADQQHASQNRQIGA